MKQRGQLLDKYPLIPPWSMHGLVHFEIDALFSCRIFTTGFAPTFKVHCCPAPALNLHLHADLRSSRPSWPADPSVTKIVLDYGVGTPR